MRLLPAGPRRFAALACVVCTLGTALARSQPLPKPSAPMPLPRNGVAAAVPLQLPVPVARTDSVRPDTLHVSAGRGRYVRENGQWVSYLEDGVRLENDSTTIDSRRARIYRTQGRGFFYESVVVHDRGVVMKGDEGEFSRPDDIAALRGRVTIEDRYGLIRARRVRYWRKTQVAWLWGQVDFKDAKNRVQADSVLYHEAQGTGEAFGSVVITDLETGSEARGSHAVYDRKSGEARLEPQPLMVLREKGADNTEVRAADLRFDRDRSVVRARGNVQIRRGTTLALADSAVLYRNRDVILLRGHPTLDREGTTMRGHEIDVYYKAKVVERVAVRVEAQLLQARADTSLIRGPNEVRGDSAQLYFEHGELARAVVIGQASSRFVPEETQKNRVSRNEARADSILMIFQKNAVDEVVFRSNATGTYRYFEGNLDSLRAPVTAHFDSTFGVVVGDSTRFDFDRRAETVEYSGESILYLAKQNDLLLQKAAEVRYQGNTLRAGRIHYDADTDLLDATERPALDDAGDRVFGERMGYDMNSREAWIQDGSTTYDQGYYAGQTMRKKQDGILQVRNASYTTCDLAQPHYRFQCDRMKIYLHKRIVGRPVHVYLGHVPVMYLPFIYNSTETNRHSGFQKPDIGFGFNNGSRFIRGLDYFWAASKYYDFIFSSDFTDRPRPNRSSISSVLNTSEARSVRFAVATRYKVRYHAEGILIYNVRKTFDPRGDVFSYTIGGQHQQTLGERTRLSGSLDYASSDRAVRDVNQHLDIYRSLERNLRSGLTLRRQGDWLNTTLGVDRTQLLNPGSQFTGTLISSHLPNLNVSFPRISLAPAPQDARHEPFQAFFHSLQFQPAVAFSRTATRSRFAVPAAEIPAVGATNSDSFATRDDEVVSASTGVTLGRPVHVAMLSLTPSVGYSESYVRNSARPNDLHSHRSVNTSVGASTTMYGLFYPNVFVITALRHRLDPRATLGWQPNIIDQQIHSTRLSLSLANTFDAKVRGGKNGARKIDGLLDWQLSTGYNPDVPAPKTGGPTRKWSLINSNITINRSGPFRMTISQIYDPYRGRIISTQVPFAMRLGGRFGYGDTGIEEMARNRVVEEEGGGAVAARDTTVSGGAAEDSSDVSPTRPPVRPLSSVDGALGDVKPVAVGGTGSLAWALSLSYSLRRSLGHNETASVPISFSVQPTRNWDVSFGTYYDAKSRVLGLPSIRITRQLHCWKASFTRVRLQNDLQYYFRLYVEKHENELFFESGDRGLRQ